MGQLLTLNREKVVVPSAGNPAEIRKPRPSLKDLSREVELLRSKLQTLRLAQGRIEREAQRLADEIQSYRA